MKNHLLSFLVAILAIAGNLPLSAQTREAYVVEKDSVLTFYYDTQRSDRQGTSYDMPADDQIELAWLVARPNTTQAVFDASFADYRPTQTDNWLSSFPKLAEVKDIQNLNTSMVNSMRYMFYQCPALTSLDLSSFDTRNVSDMSGMFVGCSALASLNLSSFDTKNVASMESMFALCSSLTSLDLSSFNPQNVSNMNGMFSLCQALKTIYSNQDWSVNSRVIAGNSDKWMFLGCSQLVGAVSYSESHTGIAMANPTSGYFTPKEATAIGDVTSVSAASDGTAYDLSGRRVSEGYKGIVIKGGKKTLQR